MGLKQVVAASMALAVTVLGSGGCATSRSQGGQIPADASAAVNAEGERLDSSDEGERSQAAEKLGQIGPEAVVLRYCPEIGTVTKHRLQVSSRMYFSEDPEPHYLRPLRAEVSASLDYIEEILSATKDAVRAEVRLGESEVEVTANGVKEATSLGSFRGVREVDALRAASEESGEVEDDYTDVSGDAYMALTECNLDLGAWSGWLDILRLPRAAVEPGDTWKAPASYLDPWGELPPRTVVRSRLRRFTTLKDRECAEIETSLQVPMHEHLGETSAPEGLALQRALKFRLVWHYDYEDCVTVLMEGSIEVEGAFSDSSGRTGVGKVHMNIKDTLLE